MPLITAKIGKFPEVKPKTAPLQEQDHSSFIENFRELLFSKDVDPKKIEDTMRQYLDRGGNLNVVDQVLTGGGAGKLIV